ncbi:MAG: hypothetical protein U1E39_17260 [Planctomycetota bacterium]
MTDAPLPAAPRPSKSRYREAPKKKGVPIVLWIVVGAFVVVGAIWWFVMKAPGDVQHRFPIDWPVATASGDVVAIKHAVKAGDVFETRAVMKSGVVMGADHDPMAGMSFLATVTWRQTVAAADGGRLRSTYVVKLDQCDGTLPILGFVKTGLMGDKPVTFELMREASGKPVAGTGRLLPGLEKERDSLDYCLSGLSDLTSSYLPARDVRVGEVWDLHDAAALGNLVEMMRFLATINPRPEGFPQGKLEGRVGEPTPETKDGEACVRLKVALQALCEGEVVAPARAGYISSVAKVEGKAWVSVETGVLWALETVAEGRSTYKKSNSQEERRVRQFVTLATKRVDPNATPGDK